MAIRARIHAKYVGYPCEHFQGYAMRFGQVEAVFLTAHMQVDAKLCEPIPVKGSHAVLFFSHRGLVNEVARCEDLNYPVDHFQHVLDEWPTDYATVSRLAAWAQRLPLPDDEAAANVSSSGKRIPPPMRPVRRLKLGNA